MPSDVGELAALSSPAPSVVVASFTKALRSTLPSVFLQPVHLHAAEHKMPAWKHSQYRFRHFDLVQRHPLRCFPSSLAFEPACRHAQGRQIGTSADGCCTPACQWSRLLCLP